eukprot:3332346-Pyramimonas_sp.AAC.1
MLYTHLPASCSRSSTGACVCCMLYTHLPASCSRSSTGVCVYVVYNSYGVYTSPSRMLAQQHRCAARNDARVARATSVAVDGNRRSFDKSCTPFT